MSRHEGVSCDNCLTSNFQEKRFKCLTCYDYDLCEICFENKVSTSRHSSSHPMQCILTKRDFDLFYGGEGTTMDDPPALTCPICGKLGFTVSNLQEHVNSQHLDTSSEVVCPICATVPAGEPNHVTDDFATHLAIEHNTSHRSHVEDPIGAGRQNMRRMFHPGRGIRGARHHRNGNTGMHFSSGPSSLVPGFSAVSNAAATALPQSREPFSDPIAELLSQLSGVRRSAQQLQQNVTTSSQLQELQAQLQLERQRASIIRQQLDRIPAKIQAGQSAKQTGLQATNNQGKSYATAAKGNDKDASAAVSEDEDPRLLLSQIYRHDSTESDASLRTEIAEQSLFVRELIHTLRVENETPGQDDDLPSLAPRPSAARARATPVDCRISTCPTAVKPDSKNAQRLATGTDNAKSDPPAHDGIDTVQAGAVSGRAGTGENAPARRNGSGEKSRRPSDLKKDPGARSAPQFAGGASNVSDLVRSPTACPVSSFPVLVSGSAEQ